MPHDPSPCAPSAPSAWMALLVVVAIAAGARAQTPLQTYLGDQAADYFGFVLATLDVDGDGTTDLLVATYAAEVGGPDTGLVRIYSGATGALLREHVSPAPPDTYGWAADGLGDLDGDGKDEYAVGAYRDSSAGFQKGAVYVHSGATGAVLAMHVGNQPGDRFGFSVADAGDVDGDGKVDLIVGAPFSDVLAADGGRVRVVSAIGGNPLLSLVGTAPGAMYGYVVAGAGDTDGDGRDDVLIGAPFAQESRGRVELRSGQGGALLWSLEGDAPGDEMGRAMTGVGDVDGDGRDDVALGIRWDDAGGHESGSVRVLSGADGSLLWIARGDVGGDLLGFAVAPGGDVNGDGVPDVLVGAPRYGQSQMPKLGYARVLSGRDGAPVYTLEGSALHDRFGASLVSMGDLDADGRLDLAVGAWADGTNGGEAGAVHVVSGDVPWLGMGLAVDGAVGPAELVGAGTLLPGQGMALSLLAPAAAGPHVLVMGFSTIHLPFKGGVMVPAPDLLLPGLQTDAQGQLVLATPWPPGIPPGSTIALQAWRPDLTAPGGFAASNALLAIAP